MAEVPLTKLVRIVSATFSEYEAGLRQALPGGVTGGPHQFVLEEGEVRIRITIERLPDRVIALLRLPQLQATWEFDSGSEDAKQSCLKRIDWSMKRGGG